jgi:ADP-heptose:LPS heptosyltransferase
MMGREEVLAQLRENPPRRIAILRALQLGDLLQAVPAMRALRRGFPEAEITLIGLPWAADFVRRFSAYLDRFVEFVGYPGIDEVEYQPEKTAAFLAEQQAYRYDLVIQMHGSGKTSNPLTLALGGRITAGYYDAPGPGELDLSALYPQDEPERCRNLELATLLGCSMTSTDLEFPLYTEDRREAERLLQEASPKTGPLIGLHPGARPPSRRWPMRYFAEVGDTLARRFGATIVLTGGSSEIETARAVQRAMQAPALCLAGETSLGALAGLIERFDLFVSNDTGPAHIADALRTRSVVIFGPADYRRWAPLDQEHHPVVRRPVACSPCGFWECPIDHRCLNWLMPATMLECASTLLKKGKVCATS